MSEKLSGPDKELLAEEKTPMTNGISHKNCENGLTELCSLLESKANVKPPTRNELKFWFVIMSERFKTNGLTFISKIQNYAKSTENFIIMDPKISFMKNYETSEILDEIEDYSKEGDKNYQMFLSIIPNDKLSLFSILKNTSSTLLTDLKVQYPNEILDFKDGDTKSGVIKESHIPKHSCPNGTAEVHGVLILKNSPVRLKYEKCSFNNWPTYYPGDKVLFNIKFNHAKTHFAIYKFDFSDDNFKGIVKSFKYPKHQGMFLVETPGAYFNQLIAFKLNEFFASKEESDISINSFKYEFSLVSVSCYIRAIRIIQLK
ncbi:unnamed protein product [Gordionus sp. m RMFG-2023]